MLGGGPRDIWKIPKISGTFLGGPHNKDYNILRSLLESPYLGKPPYETPGKVPEDRRNAFEAHPSSYP